MQKRFHAAEELPRIPDDLGAWEYLRNQDQRLAEIVQYIKNLTNYPLCFNQQADYYPLGEKMFSAMPAELEQAGRFIFVEYFIVEPGLMWDTMVEILARKAASGVDVRGIYDDLGSISTYNPGNVRELKRKGILGIAFNPLIFMKGTLNYRDHLKMLVIDGKVTFSGGINLADNTSTM
ncbi:MAG: phospholipase D-like domain-containing protein [Butyricicoccus sp.]|nr:phospholipase D-like domain-containing protein [Butyricicoccus sp.]